VKCLVVAGTKFTGEIKGPLTLVSGKNRRLTFFECLANDLNSMIDLAKTADLVLLLGMSISS
jgi:ribosome biogenesis protein BMS1